MYEFKNIEEEKINKHYGMRLVKTMIRESFCHNKIIFEFKNCNESPNCFYNAEMKLIKIVNINYQNNNHYKELEKETKDEIDKFFE